MNTGSEPEGQAAIDFARLIIKTAVSIAVEPSQILGMVFTGSEENATQLMTELNELTTIGELAQLAAQRDLIPVLCLVPVEDSLTAAAAAAILTSSRN